MKKTMIAALMTANLLSCGASLAGQNGESPTIDAICADDAIECLISDAGVVVGRPGTTAVYAAGIDSAAKSFEQYFGRKAPKAAVVLGEVVDGDIRSSLLEAYPVVLPWFTIKDREILIARSVRTQILRQYPDMDEAMLEATVARSVKASLNANGPGADNAEDMHQGVFAHELGHLYFIRTFWPEENLNVVGTQAEEVSRYGGPGPDWLDEMAAVLMETKALTRGREAGLAPISESADYSALWPLETYFSMVHPAYEQALALVAERQRTAAGRAQGSVVILSPEDLTRRDDGRSPAMFYSQSRGFADYMIEISGDEQIFAKVAAHIAEGGTMENWLQQFGKGYGFASTTPMLETDFQNWLIGRYIETTPNGHDQP